MIAETVNGTAWATIQRYLERSAAHVECVQEHKLPEGDIAAASA